MFGETTMSPQAMSDIIEHSPGGTSGNRLIREECDVPLSKGVREQEARMTEKDQIDGENRNDGYKR